MNDMLLHTLVARRPVARRKQLFDRYGLTWAAYVEYLAWHGSSCAICGATQAERSGRFRGPVADFCVDHDRAVTTEMRIRGILCFQCNSGLSAFKDLAERLPAAPRGHRGTGYG